jgi:hypothetical protein
MSDHLTRLAARALGHTGVVHPRVPSRFETPGGLELEAHLERDVSSPAGRSSAVASADPGIEHAAHVGATPPPRVARVSPGEAMAVTAPPRESGRARGGMAADVAPGPLPPTAPRRREDAAAGRQAPEPGARPAVVVELPARGDAPGVRVTIGRVEVRAVTPPPARPAPARTRPRLTLDEYVRLRDEGSR